MTYYKPLTPKFREDIKQRITEHTAELNTCQQNEFIKLQKEYWRVFGNLIDSLPDGYLIPMGGEINGR